MRLKAMHEMTEQLPDVTAQSDQYEWVLIGKSTASGMISGAKNGMKNEINGIVSLLKEKYAALRVLMTGGDAALFESNVKGSIFVRSNLVPLGLNQILINNEDI
jgi:type III pantothenate kinase